MNSKKFLCFWAYVGTSFLLSPFQGAYAAGTQTFTKELLTPAIATQGEPVGYRFKISCSSSLSDCGNLTLEDALPEGLEVISCVVPPDFTVVSCDSSNSVVKVTKNSAFKDGDHFDIEIHARIKPGTAAGSVLVSTSTSTITSPDTPENGSLVSTANTVTVESISANW